MSAAAPWTISAVRDALRTKEISAHELTKDFFARIENRNRELNAFLALSIDRAYAQADRIDAMIAKGDALPPLAGVPIAVKDVISTRGVVTTCGSKILETYVPPYDATAVERLESAGAVILGKTNCDEFAMGSSNENSAYGPVRNPVALDRVPGGSSGGSAAAVAAGLAVAALGTDTGGSIRQPGACCGIPGMMPTYGRVSRYGLIAFASSLDRIGPLTQNVTDAAVLMAIISGHDSNDSTSAAVPVPDYAANLEKPLAGIRIGVPEDYFGEGLDPEVREKVLAGIALLEKLGASGSPCTCRTLTMRSPLTTLSPRLKRARTSRDTTGSATAFECPSSSLREMYKKTRERGFGPEVKRRIMLGTYVLSAGYYDAYYLRAQKVRSLIARDFADAFQKVDAIITPTAPTPAFRLGERTADPLQMYLADIYTVTGSLAGIPGISIPCGKTKAGLPIGMQIFAPHFEEGRVLQLARAFEKADGFTI